MTLDRAKVASVAELARLAINDDELSDYQQALNDILALVDQLQGVDTSTVEPLANPLDATQRLRADVVTEGNQREQLMSVAPHAEGGFFLVPKVID